MQVTAYQLPELRFACCYHVYLHWRTHRRRPYPELEALTAALVHTLVEPLGIHVLTCNSSATETRLLVSLRPEESISTCASKVKGPISKWLRERLRLQHPETLLARGYFACTSGQSTAAQVNAYLDSQAAHHGYNERVIPPVYVKSYRPEEEPEPWWHADHACTYLQFHLVLATTMRRGVFGSEEGAYVSDRWAELQREHRFALRKASFVPDHVHVAVLLHPAKAPAELALLLMNEGQRALGERFAKELVRTRIGRVWQPSAYIGSFGDLATPQVRKYIERWHATL